jgi:pimeloyl-ACP methyl ester carboxylesterase
LALALALAAHSAWLPVARAVSDEGQASAPFSAGAMATSESTKPSSRVSASVAALPLPSPDAVLYDQYNSETVWGISSQDLTDADGRFDAYDNMAADDFHVPDHFQWRLTTVDAMGDFRFDRYHLLEGVNVWVFENDPSSMKPALAVCSYSNLTPSLDEVGSLRIDLPTPCLVRQGHHWLSVQASMPWLNSAGDQWFWRWRSVQSSEKAKWRNPSDGLRTGCVDWMDTAACDPSNLYPDNPDLVFRLLGTSEVMPVEVDVSTLSLTPNGDGWYTQNPVDVSFNIRCTAATGYCNGKLNIEMGSAGDVTRFYVYAGDHLTPGHAFGECAPEETLSSSYTLRRLKFDCPSFFVAAGQSVVAHIGVWIQPSVVSSFEVSASWEARGEDLEKVRVDAARIHPVIFIPGILGTMPPMYGIGLMDPNLDSYTPLLTTLEKMGYERGASLFTFPYDWRRSNDFSASVLAPWIRAVLAIANGEEYVGGPSGDATGVDLVVHSMGGLITRAYVQGAGYGGDVRKAIFIASPHKGFPATYRTYEGLTWDMYLYDGDKQQALRWAMDLYIWPTLIRKKYSPWPWELALNCIQDPGLHTYYCNPVTLAKWSHDSTRGAESLAQMLPTSDAPDYLTCGGIPGSCPQTVNPYGRPKNPWLDELNANVGTLAGRLGLENIYVIYGTGSYTETDYPVDDPEPVPNFWRNGRPLGATRSSLGDDLIPEYSTNIKQDLLPGIPESNVKPLSGPTARHKEIVYHQQVQQSVVPTFLGAVDLPFSTEYESGFPWDASPLILSLQCPLNLTVTDPEGHRVGFDPSTGGSVVEIPGAIYAAPNVEGQYIILPGSPAGTYQIAGTAHEAGEYRLEVARLEPNGPRQLALFGGTISTGETLNFTFDVEDLDTPPTIRSVVATPEVLWPVNHQLIPVSVAADVSDDLDPAPVCHIVSVAGGEPGNAPGDGNTGSDWNITGPLTLELRAERSGRGAGRTYTITVECADASGNRSEAPVTVRVPHDQRRK